MDAGAVSWLTVGPLWISLFTEATNARAIVAVSIPALTANAACTRWPQASCATAEGVRRRMCVAFSDAPLMNADAPRDADGQLTKQTRITDLDKSINETRNDRAIAICQHLRTRRRRTRMRRRCRRLGFLNRTTIHNDGRTRWRVILVQ